MLPLPLSSSLEEKIFSFKNFENEQEVVWVLLGQGGRRCGVPRKTLLTFL